MGDTIIDIVNDYMTSESLTTTHAGVAQPFQKLHSINSLFRSSRDLHDLLGLRLEDRL